MSERGMEHRAATGEPDYDNYPLEELRDARESIDDQQWPARVARIDRLIRVREREAEEARAVEAARRLEPRGPGTFARWWTRNWLWVVPAMLILVSLLAAGGFFGVRAVVDGMVRSSWAYTESMERAEAHPGVIDALGEPLVTPRFLQGEVSSKPDGSGSAELRVPIEGPAGKGTLVVIAERRRGKWSFETAEVEVEGRDEAIDLLDDGS